QPSTSRVSASPCTSATVTAGSTSRHAPSSAVTTVVVVAHMAAVATWTHGATSTRLLTPRPPGRRRRPCRGAPGASVQRGAAGREGGRAGDAGGGAQRRGDDGGAQVEPREELLVLLAHAAADDDEVRPQQVLDHAEVPLQPRRPGLPVEVLALARGVGRAALGVLAVDLEVA